MTEISCNLLTLTRLCGFSCGVAIIVMAVLRFFTLSGGNIQQFILTVHFM